jgi:hypothetical protein
VYRTLLRPTEQSQWQDFGQLAESSGGEFTDWMGLQVEGGLMLAMNPRLVLDVPKPSLSRKRIFEKVFDQTGGIPPRKKPRRESSRAQDDSAERAKDEKLMLLGDVRAGKDFQPRFSTLVVRDEFRKRKAEEEKAGGKAPVVQPSMLHVEQPIDKRLPPVTIDSIQAQTKQFQRQGPINPAQLTQHIQPQPTAVQLPPARARVPLPAARQEVPHSQRLPPQQQRPSTATTSNAPTPLSSSPQVSMQRLPATPRNMPSTPRQQPSTPQKHPTPQGVMTPVSSHPSPMMKSTSQTEEPVPQRQFVRGVVPPQQGISPNQTRGLPLPLPQFLECLKSLGFPISYEQFAGLDPRSQTQLVTRVESVLLQRTTQQQQQIPNAAGPGNYQTTQNYLQQGQRPLQPGLEQQQRMLAQKQQQFFAGPDAEMLRMQLAQQRGNMPPAELQNMFQQQLHVRQQQQQAAVQRQLVLQQQNATMKLPNGQIATQQGQQYRQRVIQQQQRLHPPQQLVPNSAPFTAQFMASLTPDQKDRFQAMDGLKQSHTFQAWLSKQQQHLQQQQQLQQQQGVQYNPFVAQNLARMQGQGQQGTQMMRQGTNGGG